MATRKTYNSVDDKDNLLLVEGPNGGFGGYDMELLVDSLSPLEVQLLICTQCNGIMNKACQVGEDQLHMCEICIGDDEEFQPMKLSRNSIPKLNSKCPLCTRGCLWSGSLVEVEEHLDSCSEFVINCPNNCEFIFKRSELETHGKECHLSKVECEHCNLNILNLEMDAHKEVCIGIQIECPNDCSSLLKRLELKEHLSNDCPNMLIMCPFNLFGCKELLKKCEFETHQTTFESKHTQLQLSFALTKIATLEEDKKQTEKQYSDELAELKQRLDSQEETIISLEQEKSLKSKDKTNQIGSVDSLTGSGEIFKGKSISSPSLFTTPQEETGVVIKNIGTTVEYRNVISNHDKTVIHFFDNSCVSHGINLQYKHTADNFPTIKFCQANVSNDRGMPKVTGVKVSHEIQMYNKGVKVSVLRWKDVESLYAALCNLQDM